jgi:hypothetical protein
MTEELPTCGRSSTASRIASSGTSLRLEHNHARVARLGVAPDRGSRPAGMGRNKTAASMLFQRPPDHGGLLDAQGNSPGCPPFRPGFSLPA